MSIDPEVWQELLVKPGSSLLLGDLTTESDRHVGSKKKARDVLKHYRKEIEELLRVLAAEQQRSLLLILQGMDASGKDSTVRRVFTGVNPQNCRVVSFKEPTREDAEHNYLWRVTNAAPRRGELRIFNRSQYEDALPPHTPELRSSEQVQIRLRQIADLERFWAENGITIRKCFLHISRKEQTERFRSRMERADKQWKVKKSDFADRKLWPQYQAAYETALAATSTEQAPWYVIPADRKWYRDLAVAGIVLSALRAMDPKIPGPSVDIARRHL